MQYWVPAWEFVSRSESWVAHAVARRIAEAAADPALYDSVTREIARGAGPAGGEAARAVRCRGAQNRGGLPEPCDDPGRLL
ncbi:hypothetical protein O0544_20645 [Edwardsiella anguillarum]|nr:hypothetical protein [Edwardsiella anguillarum]